MDKTRNNLLKQGFIPALSASAANYSLVAGKDRIVYGTPKQLSSLVYWNYESGAKEPAKGFIKP
ncbi:hypothetical protein [Arsenicibacter rosenii]|uniref:hypothetical protein n=1 Tax=Arsenicibacter rosenii TaxID=1750698 RepID=UPI0008F8A6CB|nr:hypothetical protein [Arsenicibacter rosenii]